MTEMQEGAPRGAFLPSSLMYLYSGAPMHLCSGVDILERRHFVAKRRSNVAM
jgi:hypothetical protein